MAADLGKVGIVMKGDYNSGSAYEELDAVTYNNALYIAKQAVPAGTTPTNTTYWQLAVNTGIKTKKVTLEMDTMSSFSQTAAALGSLATVFGIPGLTQDKIISINVSNAALTPGAILCFGTYTDILYVAATQSCTMSADANLTVTYFE